MNAPVAVRATLPYAAGDARTAGGGHPDRPLRVVFVCAEYPPGLHGGIGTCVQVLARAFVAAGHEVRVIGPSAEGERYADDQGVRVWRLPVPAGRLGWVRARVALWHVVAGWCRRGEVDVVEVPDYEGWAAGWPRLPVPVVARANGGAGFFAAELGRPLARSARVLEGASLRRVDAWCAASRYCADVSERCFGLRRAAQAVLYNPVEPPRDVDMFTRAASARPGWEVVYTGTLTEKKGVLALAAAWRAVQTAHPAAELHVFGKDGVAPGGGSMRDEMTRRMGTDARVRFHGHATRDRLFEALTRARVAVFPSASEAFGIAPVEAMAAGCPTVYSTCGPGPEVVRDGVDGLLVDPRRPATIAEALDRVLADDALAARLGAAGPRRVSTTFSVDVLLPQNEAFYRGAVRRFAAVR